MNEMVNATCIVQEMLFFANLTNKFALFLKRLLEVRMEKIAVK